MFRLILISILFLASTTCLAVVKDDGSQIQAGNYYPRVKFETSMGDIIVELNRKKAPITVNNFLRYVQKRSYEGTIFHRVVIDFVVQGGGYDENFAELFSYGNIFNESGNGLKNEKYTIAMARQDDPHTANRQFFFNMEDNVTLDPGRYWGYAVFGSVVEGYEVVDAMSLVPTHVDPTWGWSDVPVEKVILQRATILPMEF
ncbi:MAG: peptidylprolyl isomerase [Paraglaciecola sp.]|uniref:peptidylprolyl isomerase n=1 Tax=Paraglaciecola sp. TaxID=1920173 RepID=UPI00273DC4F8|nr:peptidylprolyl isomerase [Paraglaciecola sp.]MDP5031944.1 peptidylprolyl isomerase [Paraglaciecola sp.]MDP5039421.1 peptidylprolyl isomerase [Paraglaciecola sp.]MDP5129465.1 peptidylprolyl isomerase [Paraglaciecola sp.]